MAGTHSKYSPSKADMWGNCYAALTLIDRANLPPEKTNEHGASGTFTHSIAERLNKDVMLDPQSFLGVVEEHYGFTFKCDQDRIDRALFFVDYIRDRSTASRMEFFEITIDHSHVVGIEGQTGTADCVVADLATHTLEVHDLKDGQGAVPITTLQLVVYMLAAMKEFSYLDTFLEFKVFIHQPRLNVHDEYSYTRDQLGDVALKLYKAARRSEEVATLSEAKIIAAATPGELQCKWCRVRGSCPARAAKVQQSIEHVRAFPRALSLTNEQLAEALSWRAKIEAWFDDAYGEATRRAIDGQEIPGWQLSEGRKGNRKWLLASEETVSDELFEHLGNDTYTKKLISPAEAEKALRRAKAPAETWAKLQDFIERSDASIVLVPAADGKPIVQVGAVEFQDISNQQSANQ